MEMILCCGRGAIGFKPGTGVFRITYVKPYDAALWSPRVQDVQLSMILVPCTNVRPACHGIRLYEEDVQHARCPSPIRIDFEVLLELQGYNIKISTRRFRSVLSPVHGLLSAVHLHGRPYQFRLRLFTCCPSTYCHVKPTEREPSSVRK
jgi:hypothetical protein